MMFRTVCGYILLPAIAGLLTVYFLLNWPAMQFASTDVNRGDASRRNTTLLSNDAWVEFQLPTGATTIRLLTNGAVDTSTNPKRSLSNPRSGLKYSVKYQLLSKSRRLIHESDYHFRSRTKQILDFESQKMINPLLFGKSGLLATQTRMAQFSCTRFTYGGRLAEPTILRVKILNQDPEVQEVVARVDSRCLRKDLDKRSVMQRISQRAKDRVSKCCVYDHALLSDSERKSLLRWQSISAAPIGKTEQRFLYFIGDDEDIEIGQDIIPSGVLLLPERVVAIPVPDGEGMLRIECERLMQGDSQPYRIAMNWNGNDSTSNWRDARTIDAKKESFELATDGGLLELQSDSQTVINAYWRKSVSDAERQSEIDITPEPQFQRSSLCDSRDVTFSISHINNRSTPFRLTARVGIGSIFRTAGLETSETQETTDVNEFDEVLNPVPINWHYMDDHGSVVQSGQLKLAVVPSRYDMFWYSNQAHMVSEVQRFHFEVPGHVAQIKFEMPANQPNCTLLTGAVRPAGMPAVTSVPGDYLAFEKSQSTNRKWFILHPDDHDELVQQNRSFIIRAQPRSVETDPAMAAGLFDWIKFTPKNESIARQLLVPQSDIQQIRQQAYHATFYELDTARDYAFEPFDGQVDVARKLMFLGEQAPGRVRLYVNDRLLLDEEVLSMRGEFDLENRSIPQQGILRIETEFPTKLFVGGCQVDAPRKFLKRSANRLHDGRISFEFDKKSNEEELVTLLVYCESDSNAEKQCRLKVDIESGREGVRGAGFSRESASISDSWTIRNRIFELQESSEEDSYIVGSSGKLNAAYRCFLKVGSDLPPGKYTVNAELLDDDRRSYAMLYTCRPGQLPQRKIRMQNVFSEVKR